MNSPHTRLRRGSIPTLILAMLGCAPARLSREVATFQRELDVQLGNVLEPRTGPGLEAACHRDPIVWMHFIVDGSSWRLMSVDARGKVGVWTMRGLQQTWSLREDELSWVGQVAMRQSLSEDAEWLYDRARAPWTRVWSGGPFGDGGDFQDIAPIDDRHWIGVEHSDIWDSSGLRLTASGRWFAIGTQSGDLAVRPSTSMDDAPWWGVLGCANPAGRR